MEIQLHISFGKSIILANSVGRNRMNDMNLDKYCTQAIQSGITEAQYIIPETVITAA